jgi:dTDP-4-amino-4,6-dideoxygalactose transaminase
LPPAASPLSIYEIMTGLNGMLFPNKHLHQLKESIKNHFNTKYCFLTSSGKASITVILKSLADISPARKYVVIPAYNCYSVPSAITCAGLKTIPCDIDSMTLQLLDSSLQRILKKQGNRILSIIPAHLFGLPSDINHIKSIVNNKEIAIIDDAAQCMGTTVEGNYLGTAGDAGIFSFSRGKAISTVEGGVIVTNRADLAELIRRKIADLDDISPFTVIKLLVNAIALSFLIYPALFWIPRLLPFLQLGVTNYDPAFTLHAYTGFQAGLSFQWKKKLTEFLSLRTKKALFYQNELMNSKKVSLIVTTRNTEAYPCTRFPVIIHNENNIGKIILKSDSLGLGISKAYPSSVDCIKELSSDYLPCINAQQICRKLVTLPCHPLVRDTDARNIVDLILSEA